MARDFEDHCWKDIIDQEIIEIYESYRREVRVGHRPAVLAIDLYNNVYQGGNRPVHEVNRRYSGFPSTPPCDRDHEIPEITWRIRQCAACIPPLWT
jgi:hypothetical protein